ncbi:hypothetical protein EVAR_69450_1 [Eumeta japonica]|uniref:Uncharacterized protein n=1 Tax=Eumeta variegata TaxID=151549 RepID=A0A4C1SEM5_EUMVA|nr:hypothetical protein EVAR_69450_1 [Eumeta japonica]
MSHRTRERPAECLASLSHSTMIGLRARSTRELVRLQMYCKLFDHGPVLDVNSGSTVASGPLPALYSNTGLDTDLCPPLRINGINNKLLIILEGREKYYVPYSRSGDVTCRVLASTPIEPIQDCYAQDTDNDQFPHAAPEHSPKVQILDSATSALPGNDLPVNQSVYLAVKKLRNRWIPHNLIEAQKLRRGNWCREMMPRSHLKKFGKNELALGFSFIMTTPHPIPPEKQLTIWRMLVSKLGCKETGQVGASRRDGQARVKSKMYVLCVIWRYEEMVIGKQRQWKSRAGG